MINFNFILLDAARAGKCIADAKKINVLHDSLFRNTKEEALHMVAPYIFSFSPAGDFNKWFFANGWGKSWGTIIRAPGVAMPVLFSHFQPLLKKQNEDGTTSFFRFYDPRVLKIFLPACNKEQVMDFFGPVENFIIEDSRKGNAIVFSHEKGILQQRNIPAEIFLENLSAVTTEAPILIPAKKKRNSIMDDDLQD